MRCQELAKEFSLRTGEEFWLTLVRVVEGTYKIQEAHCKSLRLPWNPRKAQKSVQEMYKLMWEFKFLPPGRGLWMMGTDRLMEKAAAITNCAFYSTKDLKTSFSDPFCFLMDMSMLGVGCGFDTRGAGSLQIKKPRKGGEHLVEDSREGWVDLLRRVLDSYVGKDMFPEKIDYSKVRPMGSPIKGFGGTASGFGPLAELIKDIQDILDPLVGETITSTAIVDIFNLIGKCVVAGNIRRAASIAFGDLNDLDFLELKNPKINKKPLEHHRWASNNSIIAKRGMDYTEIGKRTAQNGEPGYFWIENARAFSRMIDPPDFKDIDIDGLNPCGEIPLSSAELCNLVESFPAHHDSYEEFERTLKFAYLYAKTVTLLHTHDMRTNAVMLRNRRIGTSMSGIVQAFKKHGRRNLFNWADKGYSYLRGLDKIYSRWLCIPESIKITTTKPSGSVSLLCAATPGIHYPHSEYYNRVIRFASDSPFIPKLKKAGYICIEIDPRKEPNTTAVYFPVKEEFFDRGKKDVSMWEQLENAAQMQYWWSDNCVSCTVSCKKEELAQIPKALELYETRLKGISFLPLKDHGYEHAPYQEITEEEYKQAISKLKKLDLSDTSNEIVEKYCEGDSCQILGK
jgi:adenosylcobalamin-dependent ribonucleoside-triphosphate reductase